MSIEERSLTMDNYTSSMRIVTVEPGGLTKDHSKKARLVVNFGEHGRELISPEIALRLLEALCDKKTRNAVLKEHKVDVKAVDELLNKVVFQIIPVENPRGRELVEAGDMCERKNGRGVDPNRNWAVHWGHKEEDYDPAEEFPGSNPFSEPETSMLKALVHEFKPHVWLNVHSGMEAMFLPYDHKNEVPEGPAAEATLAILERLNKELCAGRCGVGPGGKTVGYLAHGTATDYMQDEEHVGLVMTWEVYGDDNASFSDCFRIFNPLEEQGYESVVGQWTAAVFALVSALPGHPSVPELAVKEVIEKKENIGIEGATNPAAASESARVNLGRKGGDGAVGAREERLAGDSNAKEGLEDFIGSREYVMGSLPSGGNILRYAALGIACAALAGYLLNATGTRALLGRLRLGRRRQTILVR